MSHQLVLIPVMLKRFIYFFLKIISLFHCFIIAIVIIIGFGFAIPYFLINTYLD